MSDIKMLNLSLAPRTLNLAIAPKKNGHCRQSGIAASVWDFAGPGLLVVLLYVIGVLVMVLR